MNMGPEPEKFGDQQTGDNLVSREVDKVRVVHIVKRVEDVWRKVLDLLR